MKKFEDITIALLMHDFHSDYSYALYKGAVSVAMELGISVVSFEVGTFESPIQNYKMRSRLLSLVNPDDYDGIFNYSSLSNFSSLDRFIEFEERMCDIPSAHIGFQQASRLTFGIDDYSGMYDAVNHLITEHGRNKIAFISGTRGVHDAEERFRAYKQALRDNNIEYDERYVYYGTYLREDGTAAVKVFLDERKLEIDGVAGANDHMALYAMKEMQKRGISVPEQVSVVGFDDLPIVRNCTPALTTVHQSAVDLGAFAMRRLAESIRDDNIELRHEQFPAPLVVRQSCGCHAGKECSQESSATLLGKDKGDLKELNSVVNLMTREMIGNFDTDEIISVLDNHLKYFGFSDFTLCQYVAQSKAEILYDQTGHRGETIPEKQLISGGLGRLRRPYYRNVLPLFYRNESIGYFVSDAGLKEASVLEIIRDQLSGVLKGARLFEAAKRHADHLQFEVEQRTKELAERTIALEQALDVVHETSEKLERLSIMDELTGLYNRRGFMTLSTQQIALKKRNNCDLLLVLFDIDGLKTINDTLGHSAGDIAITSFADLLKGAFRSIDIIARIGGDEFVILAIDCTIREFIKIRGRLDQAIEEYNKLSNQRFKLSVSAGSALCDPDTTFTIDRLMEEADAELYKEKKSKKNTR